MTNTTSNTFRYPRTHASDHYCMDEYFNVLVAVAFTQLARDYAVKMNNDPDDLIRLNLLKAAFILEHAKSHADVEKAHSYVFEELVVSEGL